MSDLNGNDAIGPHESVATSILAITIASELAASRVDVKGTGTFLPALIDELYNLTPEKISARARIEVHS